MATAIDWHTMSAPNWARNRHMPRQDRPLRWSWAGSIAGIAAIAAANTHSHSDARERKVDSLISSEPLARRLDA